MSAHTSVPLEDIIKLVEKDVIIHVIGADDSTEEREGTITAATSAGIVFKAKGKAAVELIEPSAVYELALAPEKAKTISQAKLKPIPEGSMRKHLTDRHGISLKWCRDASEADARLFHDGDGAENKGIDHSDLGHKHVAEAEKPAEPVTETNAA